MSLLAIPISLLFVRHDHWAILSGKPLLLGHDAVYACIEIARLNCA